jgi:DNA/RNA-binding domain of Phe-tRNA-synthetase-like protein
LNPTTDNQLEGWTLFWAQLERQAAGNPNSMARLREQVTASVRDRLAIESLAEHPPVAALRTLFKQAGCNPSRYRPASEALLRRLLKQDDLPAISPLVDLNNCLSATLAVPCCVMAEGSFEPPFVFRAGAAGESYDSLRGPFNLEKKPLLLDARGPCDAPITGSQRVKVTDDTRIATVVAYLPEDVVTIHQANDALDDLLARTDTVVRIR